MAIVGLSGNKCVKKKLKICSSACPIDSAVKKYRFKVNEENTRRRSVKVILDF